MESSSRPTRRSVRLGGDLAGFTRQQGAAGIDPDEDLGIDEDDDDASTPSHEEVECSIENRNALKMEEWLKQSEELLCMKADGFVKAATRMQSAAKKVEVWRAARAAMRRGEKPAEVHEELQDVSLDEAAGEGETAQQQALEADTARQTVLANFRQQFPVRRQLKAAVKIQKGYTEFRFGSPEDDLSGELPAFFKTCAEKGGNMKAWPQKNAASKTISGATDGMNNATAQRILDRLTDLLQRAPVANLSKLSGGAMAWIVRLAVLSAEDMPQGVWAMPTIVLSNPGKQKTNTFCISMNPRSLFSLEYSTAAVEESKLGVHLDPKRIATNAVLPEESPLLLFTIEPNTLQSLNQVRRKAKLPDVTDEEFERACNAYCGLASELVKSIGSKQQCEFLAATWLDYFRSPDVHPRPRPVVPVAQDPAAKTGIPTTKSNIPGAKSRIPKVADSISPSGYFLSEPFHEDSAISCRYKEWVRKLLPNLPRLVAKRGTSFLVVRRAQASIERAWRSTQNLTEAVLTGHRFLDHYELHGDEVLDEDTSMCDSCLYDDVDSALRAPYPGSSMKLCFDCITYLPAVVAEYDRTSRAGDMLLGTKTTAAEDEEDAISDPTHMAGVISTELRFLGVNPESRRTEINQFLRKMTTVPEDVYLKDAQHNATTRMKAPPMGNVSSADSFASEVEAILSVFHQGEGGRLRVHTTPNVRWTKAFVNKLKSIFPPIVLLIIHLILLCPADDHERLAYLVAYMDQIYLIRKQVPYSRAGRLRMAMTYDEWLVFREQSLSGLVNADALERAKPLLWDWKHSGSTTAFTPAIVIPLPQLDAVKAVIAEIEAGTHALPRINDVPWPFVGGPPGILWSWHRLYSLVTCQLLCLKRDCNARWITTVTVEVLIIVLYYGVLNRDQPDLAEMFNLPLSPWSMHPLAMVFGKVFHALGMDGPLPPGVETFTRLADFDWTLCNIRPEGSLPNYGIGDDDSRRDEVVQDFRTNLRTSNPGVWPDELSATAPTLPAWAQRPTAHHVAQPEEILQNLADSEDQDRYILLLLHNLKRKQQPPPGSSGPGGPGGADGAGGPKPDCSCGQPDTGNMVTCSDPTHLAYRKHIGCLGENEQLTDGPWLCATCRAMQAVLNEKAFNDLQKSSQPARHKKNLVYLDNTCYASSAIETMHELRVFDRFIGDAANFRYKPSTASGRDPVYWLPQGSGQDVNKAMTAHLARTKVFVDHLRNLFARLDDSTGDAIRYREFRDLFEALRAVDSEWDYAPNDPATLFLKIVELLILASEDSTVQDRGRLQQLDDSRRADFAEFRTQKPLIAESTAYYNAYSGEGRASQMLGQVCIQYVTEWECGEEGCSLISRKWEHDVALPLKFPEDTRNDTVFTLQQMLDRWTKHEIPDGLRCPGEELHQYAQTAHNRMTVLPDTLVVHFARKIVKEVPELPPAQGTRWINHDILAHVELPEYVDLSFIADDKYLPSDPHLKQRFRQGKPIYHLKSTDMFKNLHYVAYTLTENEQWVAFDDQSHPDPPVYTHPQSAIDDGWVPYFAVYALQKDLQELPLRGFVLKPKGVEEGRTYGPAEDTDPEKFPCPFASHLACEETFDDEESARRHSFKHAGQFPQNATCPTCRTQFPSAAALDDHNKTEHSGKRTTDDRPATSGSTKQPPPKKAATGSGGGVEPAKSEGLRKKASSLFKHPLNHLRGFGRSKTSLGDSGVIGEDDFRPIGDDDLVMGDDANKNPTPDKPADTTTLTSQAGSDAHAQRLREIAEASKRQQDNHEKRMQEMAAAEKRNAEQLAEIGRRMKQMNEAHNRMMAEQRASRRAALEQERRALEVSTQIRDADIAILQRAQQTARARMAEIDEQLERLDGDDVVE
ncbi:hypothetical protein LTR15_002177 [Elasticomyces elasticus]|nr:hypothetical protein LTR15_002177 [Elasticomyces elasticus]